MALAHGTRLGSFDITALIGEGGMGQDLRRLLHATTADCGGTVLTFDRYFERVARLPPIVLALRRIRQPSLKTSGAQDLKASSRHR